MRARNLLQASNQAQGLSGRKYEGASKSNRLSWISSDSDANNEINDASKTMAQRARDLVRNNPHAARAKDAIVDHTVGTGIRPYFEGVNERRKQKFGKVFKKWAENPRSIDSDSHFDLYGLEALILGSVLESGECFVRRRKRRAQDKLPVPLQIQVFEMDFLDRSKSQKLSGGNEIINGIEFSSEGKRLAYWFFKEHPGKAIALGSVDSERIPASEIIHVFRKDRPGQEFGISWFSPVMIRFRDLDIFEDATLKKQQVSALFAAFVYDSGEELENDTGLTSDEELLEKLDVGTVEVLPQGKDIKFTSPPSATDFGPFVRQNLLSIASGMGITYEALTGDYSNSNYSSSRTAGLNMNRNVDKWQDRLVIGSFLSPLMEWFIEAYELTGENADGLEVRWTKPARPLVDPSKEIPAQQKSVSAGFTSLSQIIRSQGNDPEIVFKERAEELKILDQLGIATDSDPRSNLKGVDDANEVENEDS